MAGALDDEPRQEPRAPEAEAPKALEPLVQPRSARGFRRRFSMAYLLLALVAGAAIGAFAVQLGVSGRGGGGTSWSPWKPTTSNTSEAAKQIADYVAREYRLPSGNQLVGVISGPPEVQDERISAIAVQNELAPSNENLLIVDGRRSLMYVLCGLGDRCSIPEGRPSQERAELLRREALELALYTFKYVRDIDAVVVFFPPPPRQDPQATLFFRRSDFERELERPLRETLQPKTRLLPGDLPPAEKEVVDRLTNPRVFAFEFQRLPDGSPVLVLKPPGF